MQPEREFRATLRVNMDGIPGRLQVCLQWYINMVTFGLQASDAFQTAQLVMPNTRLRIQLSSDNAAWDVAKVRKAFANWIVACGLRELMEEFTHSLEESRRILAAWSLGSGEIRSQDWNDRMVDQAQRFHRLGFPDKIAFLADQYQVSLPPEKEKDLLSLNQARNCTVHRQSVVGLQDLPVTKAQLASALQKRRAHFPDEKWTNQQVVEALRDAGLQPSLEVTWLRMELFSEKDGEQKILDPTKETRLEGGTKVGLRIVKAQRAFDFGSLVRFSSGEFCEIAYALLDAAFALRDAVEARGRAMGAHFVDPAEPGAG